MIDLRKAEAEGVRYSLAIKKPGGEIELPINADGVQLYLKDRNQYSADYFGLSKAEYLKWIAQDGVTYCSSDTNENQPCKNVVASPGQTGPLSWKRLQGEYCVVHGGPDRDGVLTLLESEFGSHHK